MIIIHNIQIQDGAKTPNVGDWITVADEEGNLRMRGRVSSVDARARVYDAEISDAANRLEGRRLA